MVEARYSSKTDAWRRLQSLDGATVLSREAFLYAASTRDAPDQGWLLGWTYAVVHRLGLVLPTEVGMATGGPRSTACDCANPHWESRGWAKTTTARNAPSRPLWIRTWLHSSVRGRSRSPVAGCRLWATCRSRCATRRPEEPYDLLAETDTRRLPVVVRGLVGDLRPVTVTGPEIQASFEEPTAMLVVHGIVLLRDAAGLWSATDGRAYQIRPWRPQKPALLPTSFRFDPVGTGRFAWYRDVWHPGATARRTPQRAHPPTHVPSRTCAPTVSIQGRRPVGPPGRFQTGRAPTAAPNGAVPTER